MKTLLYRIGSDAGFFSEYNNMVLALRYCQQHHIRFVLSSGRDANFACNKGWTDYFLPFCTELNLHHQAIMNPRYEAPLPSTGKRERIHRLCFNILKHCCGVNYLTYDIFYMVRDQKVDTALLNDCRAINNHIYQYNDSTKHAIQTKISSLHLPQNYVSLHVRRGDKCKEMDPVALQKYMDELSAHSECHDVFVATDDYAVFEELCSSYPAYRFYTLTPKHHQGYDQRQFEAFTMEDKRAEMISLFADVELLAESSLFVGTLGSNIGMYLYWRMPKGKCIGVDFTEWRIW